uniref:Solute carrier family 22 member 7a n=1 Tax=Cyprinus carpio TaxID=7962 RepID=A0A8C2E9F4_CYPCA
MLVHILFSISCRDLFIFIRRRKCLGWSVGNMALLAYLIRNWRHLILVVTSPCLLYIYSCAFHLKRWIPESASWLPANGLQQESFLDLVRTPKLRKIVFFSGIFWFAVAVTYYGISFNITGFGLNIYLTQFVYVGTYFTHFTLDWIEIMCWFCCGVSSTDFAGVRTRIAVIGKGFSEAVFTIVLLYTSDLYPTWGLGYTSFIARIGGLLAPMVILIEDVVGCVVFLLPENTNRDVELTVMNSSPAALQEKDS